MFPICSLFSEFNQRLTEKLFLRLGIVGFAIERFVLVDGLEDEVCRRVEPIVRNVRADGLLRERAQSEEGNGADGRQRADGRRDERSEEEQGRKAGEPDAEFEREFEAEFAERRRHRDEASGAQDVGERKGRLGWDEVTCSKNNDKSGTTSKKVFQLMPAFSSYW